MFLKTPSHILHLKDFSTKSKLMASLVISRETRLSGMFGILALKEFRFACLDDGNHILYFQDHDDAFVYCTENVMHYQAQKTQLLRRQVRRPFH